jgi:hypothetical protein
VLISKKAAAPILVLIFKKAATPILKGYYFFQKSGRTYMKGILFFSKKRPPLYQRDSKKAAGPLLKQIFKKRPEMVGPLLECEMHIGWYLTSGEWRLYYVY